MYTVRVQRRGVRLTVWLDLLFLNNFCADAALLCCAVKTVKGEVRLLRIALTALLGALLGTAYCVFRLYYTLPRPLELVIEYAVAAALALLSARFKGVRTAALCAIAYIGYMAAFAGILTAVFTPVGAEEGEGAVYRMQALPSGVIVSGAVVFAFASVRLVRLLSARRRLLRYTVRCRLYHRGKEVEARALIDTGNRVTTRAGKPVAVAGRPLALRLLEDSLFSRGGTPYERVRVRSVGGEKEIFVFTVEKMEIYCGDKAHIVKSVAVGVGFERQGEYDLILPPELILDEGGEDNRA